MKEQLQSLHNTLTELFPGRVVFLKIDAMNFFIGELEIFYTVTVEFADDIKMVAHRASTPDDLLTQAKAYARSIDRGSKPKNNPALSAAS